MKKKPEPTDKRIRVNLKLSPQLHKDCSVAAAQSSQTLQDWISDTLKNKVENKP